VDQPAILQFAFYPRQDFTPGPPNSTDHFVSVEKDISVSCRFYVQSLDAPSILFFHGNGEVVSDYDYIAPTYNRQGINLFVADYRGYGSSGGMPTIKTTVEDAHPIFKAFREILRDNHYTGHLFVMGRSMGSLPAIELASHYHEQIKGLIIESGFASLQKGLTHLGFPMEAFGLTDVDFPNLAKIRNVTLPTLIMHGEHDTLIPPSEARDLYQNSAAEDKRLVIIPHADHNDIMVLGIQQYFTAISEFVFA
jgi:alpha-beta hydrolase superfamily lysophospholipase